MPRGTRNEGIALRPFEGVAGLNKSLESTVSIRISTGETTENLRSGDIYSLSSDELLVCGLSIISEDYDGLLASTRPMVMDDKDVDFLVIAHDHPRAAIRGSQVLLRGKLSDLKGELVISTRGEPNEGVVLGHARAGKKISVYLIHNKDVPTTSGLKARSNGAILGSVSVDLVIHSATDSIKPKKMDQEQKTDWGLPQASWFYFRALDGFLSSSDFNNALEVYLDDEVYDLLSTANDSVLKMFEINLFSLVTNSIVLEAIKGLEAEDLDSDILGQSAIYRWLEVLFAQFGDDWESWIVQNPGKAASFALSSANSLKTIVKLMEEVND
jgi:hypothetical protein